MKSVMNDTDGIVRVAESVIPEIKHQDEVRVKLPARAYVVPIYPGYLKWCTLLSNNVRP